MTINDDTFDKDAIVDGVLQMAAGLEVSEPEAIATWAVDSALSYVVEWLDATGNAAKAVILESIAEVD